MSKDKSTLYQISDPHRSIATAGKKCYKVMIGAWERGRALTIWATSWEAAVKEASDYCKPDEDVQEVTLVKSAKPAAH